MALIRVAQYSSTPTVVGDYQAQNAHLQAFTNQLMTQQFILDAGTAQPVIKQGCYVSHGGSLYVADADTPITGSPSDGSVYIRVSGTTSLTVEFVTDISGYAWNPVYTALTSGSYTLLPYLIVKASTVWTRYNFNPNNQQFGALASLTVDGNIAVGGTLGVAGAISGASVDTGQGATEVHLMNQNLRTTDSPTFASVNTGQGATEVHLMNQNVRTTDSPTFNNLNITGSEGVRSAGARTAGTLSFGLSATFRSKAENPALGTSYRVKKKGTYTFKFSYEDVDGSSITDEFYYRFSINDIPYGNIVTNTANQGLVNVSRNIPLEGNDIIRIHAWSRYNHQIEITKVRIYQNEEGEV